MELWAHFPKYPNKDYRVVTGAAFSDHLNETLDEGDVTLAHVLKNDMFDIKPMDEVIVYSRDESDYFSVQTGAGKDGLPNRAYGRMYQGMERDLSSQTSYNREHGKRIGGFRYREIDLLGEPHEIFYAHMVVWNISEDPLNIGEDYYNLHLKLMSETKVLENFIIPNRTVRQPQRASSANKRKIIALSDPDSSTVAGKAGGVINELMSFYVKPKSVSLDGWQTDKRAQEVLIDPDLYELFKGEDGQPTICPEMHFPTGTLRAALTQIFYTVDCLPVVHDGVLTYIRISEKGREIDSDFARRSWETSQMSGGEYADRLRRTYSNSLSQGTTTRFIERMGFRNSDAPLMTLGNMRLEFSHPIYKINKLLLCFYRENGTYSDYRTPDGTATKTFSGNGTQTEFSFDYPIGNTASISSGSTTDYANANGQWHNKLYGYDVSGQYVDVEFDNPPPNGVSFKLTFGPVPGFANIFFMTVGDGEQKIIRINIENNTFFTAIRAYLSSSYVAGTPFRIELPFSVTQSPAGSVNGMVSFAYPPSSGASFSISCQKMKKEESGYGVDPGLSNDVVKFDACDVVKYDMTKLVLQNAVRNVLSEDWQQLNIILNNLRSGKYSISDLAKFKMCTVGFDIGSKYITGWGSLYQWMESIYNPQASYIENIIAILAAMYTGGTDSWDAKNFRDGSIYQFEDSDYILSKPTGNIINTNISGIIPPAVYNTDAVTWIVEIVKNIVETGDASGNQTLRMKGVFFECEYEGFVEGAVEYTKDEHDGIVVKDDSQSASFTYTSADGVQEKGKINRLGNKTITMAARYKDLYSENIYDLADYDEDSNIVYQRTFAIFKDYVQASYIMCKDYVIRNYFTSVWSKKRPYGLASYGESVKRNEIEHVQLLISPDQQYNWDLPFTFDVFDEARFVGDYLLSFWKSNYDWNNYGKQEKTTLSSAMIAHDGSRYMLEAQPFIAGDSFCVTVSMNDNVSAGQYIKRFAPSVSGYGKAVWNRKADRYEPSNVDNRFGDLSIFDDLTGSVMDWYNTASENETGFSLSNRFCLFGVNQAEKEKATRFLPSVLSVSDGVYGSDLLPLPKMPNWMATQNNNVLNEGAFDYHLHSKSYMKDGQETLVDTFEFEPIKTKGMSFSKYFMLLSDLNDHYSKITLDTPTGQLDAPLFISMASLYAPAGTQWEANPTDTPYRMSVSYDVEHFPSLYGPSQSQRFLYETGMSNDGNDWNVAVSSQQNPLVVRQDFTQNVMKIRQGNALLLAWYLPVDMMDLTLNRYTAISNPQTIEFAYGYSNNNWETTPSLAYFSATPLGYTMLSKEIGGKTYLQVRMNCEVATLFKGDYEDQTNIVKLCGWLDRGFGTTYLYIDHTYETYQDMIDNYASDNVSVGDIIYVKHDERYMEVLSYHHAYPEFYECVSAGVFNRIGGAEVFREGVTLFSYDTFITDWATQFNSPGTNPLEPQSPDYTAVDGTVREKYIHARIDKDLVMFSGAYTSTTMECWFNGSPVAYAHGDNTVKRHYIRGPIMATNGVGWGNCFYPLSGSTGTSDLGSFQKKISDYIVTAAPINDKVNLVWRVCPEMGYAFNPDAAIADIDNASFHSLTSTPEPTFDYANKTFSFSFSVSKEDVASSAELRGKSIRCYYHDDDDLLWHFVIGFNLSKDAKFVDDMYEDDEDVTAEIKAFVSVLQTRENRVYDKATGDMVGKLVNFADKGDELNLIPSSNRSWYTEDGSASLSLESASMDAYIEDTYEGSFGIVKHAVIRPEFIVDGARFSYKKDVSLGSGYSISCEFGQTIAVTITDNLATDGTVDVAWRRIGAITQFSAPISFSCEGNWSLSVEKTLSCALDPRTGEYRWSLS